MDWRLALALGIGGLLGIQIAANARLGRSLETPMLAALVNFTVGGVVLFLGLLAARTPFRFADQSLHPPLWAWIGGLLGGTYVAAGVYLAPQIGVAAFSGLIVAGQMIGSTLIDHFGVLGATHIPLNPPRLLGIALLLVGAVLVKRF